MKNLLLAMAIFFSTSNIAHASSERGFEAIEKEQKREYLAKIAVSGLFMGSIMAVVGTAAVSGVVPVTNPNDAKFAWISGSLLIYTGTIVGAASLAPYTTFILME